MVKQYCCRIAFTEINNKLTYKAGRIVFATCIKSRNSNYVRPCFKLSLYIERSERRPSLKFSYFLVIDKDNGFIVNTG